MAQRRSHRTSPVIPCQSVNLRQDAGRGIVLAIPLTMATEGARRSLIDNPAFLEQLESLDHQPLVPGFALESVDQKEQDGRSFEPIWPEIRKKEPRGQR